MKNCCSVEMDGEIQKVEPIEFEPVTLERLGCIPTRSIGTRNRLFYLIKSYCTVICSAISVRMTIFFRGSNLSGFRNLTGLK